ncbi:MAG: DKNYY domain-containing protein [Prevotella sp.]|nr:DKNYY domain-containing protein [Prevotella sp.]
MKKLFKRLAVTVVTLVLLTACSNEGKYEVKNGTVYHTYWTFSFGTQEKELPEVDAASFESIKGWLGRDDSHVWFKDVLVPNADPATVKAKDYPLFRDKRDFYYKGKPMHVADMEQFRIIKQSEDNFWATDGQFIYRDSMRVEGADPATFEVIEMAHTKDKNHVYYFTRILEGADPETYAVMGIYSKDKSHVWCFDDLIEGADVETFEVDKDDFYDAHDKNGKFHNGKRVEH